MSSASRKRRRAASEGSRDLVIPLREPRALDPAVRSSIVCGVFRYLLYVRQQIPCPLEELQIAAAAERARRERCARGARSSRVNRLLSSSKSIDAVLGSLGPGLFQSASVVEVLFMIGSSTFSPREVYSIVFPPKTTRLPSTGTGKPPSATVSRIVGDEKRRRGNAGVARRVVRALIASSAPAFEADAPLSLCSVFVRASCERGSLSDLAGFQPKPTFALRIRRSTTLTCIQVGDTTAPRRRNVTMPPPDSKVAAGGKSSSGSSNNNQPARAPESSRTTAAPPGTSKGAYVWHKCDATVKGVKASALDALPQD